MAPRAGFEPATQRIETSPCDRVKPAALIGAKQPRQRVLSDAEIASLWKASDKLGYPFGPLYKLLLLTGARKNEVAGMKWGELHLIKMTWTVPPERFKSNASHLIPLSDQAVEIIKHIPRLTKGDHLFTTTYGEKQSQVSARGRRVLKVWPVRQSDCQGCLSRPLQGSAPAEVQFSTPL